MIRNALALFAVSIAGASFGAAACSNDDTTTTTGNPDAASAANEGGAGANDSGATTDAGNGNGGDGGAGGCSNPAIATSFEKCAGAADGGVAVGQSASVTGVTCDDVCCSFGYSGCVRRAPQLGLEACKPFSGTGGTCTDVFEADWSSQCICKP